MGYDYDNPYERINQSLMIQGFVPMQTSEINKGLTPAGQALMQQANYGNFDVDNVFTSNGSVDGDTSYMGIMYNGNAQAASSATGFALGNTTAQTNFRGSTFDLAHTSATPVIISGTTDSDEETKPADKKGDNTNNDVDKSFTGYKLTKDTDGKYKATYYINGKVTEAANYHRLQKADFQKCQQEMAELNKTSS